MSEISEFLENIKVFDKLDDKIKKNIKLIYVFKNCFNLETNVILITNEDRVYCFGSNLNGVLGFGHDNTVNEFTINEELSNKGIIDFKNSYYHTIARTSDGKFYGWGKNGMRRLLYLKFYSRDIYKPQLNKYLINENIIDMCCGYRHAIVLTSNNELFSFDRINQMGHWTRLIDGSPVKMNDYIREKVGSISCGFRYSMALTESGRVYSWGSSDWGQLGIHTWNEIELVPKRIQIGVKIKKITCGTNHSLLLSRDGDIYVFGSNKFGQLGIISDGKSIWWQLLVFIKGEQEWIPQKMKYSEKFTEIASHPFKHFSAALSERGIYYVWGKCSGEQVIKEPKETLFKSFDEVFVHNFQITFRTLRNSNLNMNKKEFIWGKMSLLKNKKYEKNFCEKELISSGSFGKVYKVSDIFYSRKIYAIKKIPISEQQIEKMLEEMNLITRMNIKYVVKCFDFWIEEKHVADFELYSDSHVFDPYKPLLLHIKMELCYKTLRETIVILNDELNQKYLKNVNYLHYYITSELFNELVECLNYLHARNPQIIHRDLKPTNILISHGSEGRFIKLADFGLAVIHESEDQSHTQDRGTDRYMAPEVRQSRHYDTKADIYSLGIIAQELFNIDINEPIGEKSNLEAKYSHLFDLIGRMLLFQTRKRPDCIEILREKSLWGLSLTELIKTNSIINLKKVEEIEESFHSFFIQRKLDASNEFYSHNDYKRGELNSFYWKCK